jgi:hypothetical protein
MGIAAPDAGTAAAPSQSRDAGRWVYAVSLDDHVEGFWAQADAEAMAAQWVVDRGGEAVPVATCSPAWWTRTVPGGLETVRDRLPDRANVWSIGPVTYAPDGTERVLRPKDREARQRWVWDWEEDYVTAICVPFAEWQPSGETAAYARGLVLGAVLGVFEDAKAEALRKCGLNPAARRAATEDGQGVAM